MKTASSGNALNAMEIDIFRRMSENYVSVYDALRFWRSKTGTLKFKSGDSSRGVMNIRELSPDINFSVSVFDRQNFQGSVPASVSSCCLSLSRWQLISTLEAPAI